MGENHEWRGVLTWTTDGERDCQLSTEWVSNRDIAEEAIETVLEPYDEIGEPMSHIERRQSNE